MIRAVIFDLYGTLLTPARPPDPFVTLLRKADATDFRRAVDVAQTQDLPTLNDFYRHLGLPLSQNIDELQAQLERQVDAIVPYPDVVSTLRALSEAKIQIGVISNLATPYKKPFFKHSLDALVQAAVFSCDCGFRKPDLRIYQIALNQLGVAADATIMVGDSQRCDVDGPGAVGIKGIQLIRDRNQPKQTGAIRSLDAVIPFLRSVDA